MFSHLSKQKYTRQGARKRGNNVAETKFASREAKMFLNLSRNILLPQQMFPGLRAISRLRAPFE